MKLERVEVRKVSLPLRAPFETSVGRMTAKEFLKPFIEARTLYHLRRAKVERFRAGGVARSVIR